MTNGERAEAIMRNTTHPRETREAIAAALDEAEARGRGRIILQAESNCMGLKVLNWDTDNPLPANPSKYETLRPGQSLAIVEAQP